MKLSKRIPVRTKTVTATETLVKPMRTLEEMQDHLHMKQEGSRNVVVDVEELRAWHAEMERLREDYERLEFLEQLNARNHYTGRCVLRESTRGRGWRLHETARADSCFTVRAAIDTMRREMEEFQYEGEEANDG